MTRRMRDNVSQMQRGRLAGLTLLEFAIVAIVAGILLTVLLQRMYFYRGEAERAEVHKLVSNMRVALNSRLLQAVVQGKLREMAVLAGANPIDLLVRPPVNYLGEMNELAAQRAAAGNWYFESRGRKLVYVFSSKKSFLGDSYERWYFRLESPRLPTKNAKPDGALDLDGGVALIQVDGN